MNKPTKWLLGLGFLSAIALARPAPAEANFSLSIGLPGFGLIVHDPYPPPVVYAPPVYYYPPPVAYYYRPVPVYYRTHYGYGHGRRHHSRGGYGHVRHWR